MSVHRLIALEGHWSKLIGNSHVLLDVEKFGKKYYLALYIDSVLRNRWAVYAYPHLEAKMVDGQSAELLSFLSGV